MESFIIYSVVCQNAHTHFSCLDHTVYNCKHSSFRTWFELHGFKAPALKITDMLMFLPDCWVSHCLRTGGRCSATIMTECQVSSFAGGTTRNYKLNSCSSFFYSVFTPPVRIIYNVLQPPRNPRFNALAGIAGEMQYLPFTPPLVRASPLSNLSGGGEELIIIALSCGV